MNKLINYIFVLLLAFSNPLIAQNLTGLIYDSNSQKAVYNVKVTDITNNITYFTGYNGAFDIPFNNKRKIVLQIEHIGFQTQTLSFDFGQTEVLIYIIPETINLNPVVISSNVINRQSTDFWLIGQQNIGSFSNSNSSIDDFLKYSSDINIIKPAGIFTNSPIITNQGMSDVPGRTLVLYDGIKLNKSDDGNVNWNMLPPSVVKQIQISNTANSSVLGNNAMGGAINFIPERSNKHGFHGFIKAHTGYYNTYGTELKLSQYHKGTRGFYLNLNVFGQISDGYISVPDSLQASDIEYIPTELKEIKSNFVVGYDFNGSQNIKLFVNLFDDFRGLGEKIQAETGSYTKHTSELAALKYSGSGKKSTYGASFSFQNENYFKIIESIKNGDYSLIYVNSLRRDFTANLYSKFNFFDNKISVLAGANSDIGEVYGKDEYQTSSDLVINSGNMLTTDAFAQISFKLLAQKNLNIGFGLDFGFNIVKSPTFTIQNPTSATDFMLPYTSTNQNNTFIDSSFSAFINYKITKNLYLYGSINSGYNAPSLEDLTRSGLNRYGFKLANANLTSENIFSNNIGFGFYNNNVSFKTEGYFKSGDNFIYYVETGDAIFGGRKKVIQKQNITNINIYGLNTYTNIDFDKIKLFANYSYNYSSIKKFDSIPDLVGKILTYSPEHSVHSGIMVKFNQLNLSLIGNYYSKQYIDNYNTEFLDAYYTIDFNVNAEILKNLFLDFSAQNILNHQYLIFYDQLSIGRFLLFSLKYKW
ncbi:MAG: TonB-dependent receptor [Bacteroidales bacterium]|nr:TonB-dependent receptor [Bacteroidales bacterium]